MLAVKKQRQNNKKAAGLIGRKLGMTQIFDDQDNLVPVTVLELGPCVVLAKKSYSSFSRDGSVDKGKEADSGGGAGKNGSSKEEGGLRTSLVLGFMDKFKRVNRPQKGFFDGLGVFPKSVIREFSFGSDYDGASLGDIFSCDLFSVGDYIDVRGVSKGRGFQGVIKRHNFSRGPESHGSRYHRRPGSMGACADPSRVFKGKKLPGRMGGKNRTIQNLKVAYIDKERNLLLVRGGVPGPSGGVVFIERAVKKA